MGRRARIRTPEELKALEEHRREVVRAAVKRHYDRNREFILEQRKARYKSDPQYRERQQLHVLRSDEKRKLKAQGKNVVPAYKAPKERKPLTTRVRINGKLYEVQLYSHSLFCKEVGHGVTPLLLKKLEGLGILPPATYRYPGTGVRLYTIDQIRAFAWVIAKYMPVLNMSSRWQANPKLRETLHAKWAALTKGFADLSTLKEVEDA